MKFKASHQSQVYSIPVCAKTKKKKWQVAGQQRRASIGGKNNNNLCAALNSSELGYDFFQCVTDSILFLP